MENRKQFTFYRSFLEAAEKVPKKERYGFLMAVIYYALDKREDMTLSPTQEAMFMLVKPVLDAAWRKAEAGFNGGSKTKANRKQNESKGDIEIEKEIEKEIEIETETETETKGEGFVRFWDRYPVKLGRDEAEAQWVCVRESHSEKIILDGLDRWIHSRMWVLEQGRYIPKADKWLREEWFLQKPDGAPPCGATGQLGEAEKEAIQRMFRE